MTFNGAPCLQTLPPCCHVGRYGSYKVFFFFFRKKLCKRSLVFVCRKGHRASFIWKLPPYVSLRLLLVILTLIVQLYWETSYSKSSTRGPWSASSTFPAGQSIVTREFMVKKAPWNKTSWYLMSIAYWQLVKIIHGKNVTVQSPPI